MPPVGTPRSYQAWVVLVARDCAVNDTMGLEPEARAWPAAGKGRTAPIVRPFAT